MDRDRRERGATGECALVPNSSPISQRKILFYNTLFDENASCHVAIGNSYRDTIVGGEDMTEEEFAAAGGNKSLTHVDFMIGSDWILMESKPMARVCLCFVRASGLLVCKSIAKNSAAKFHEFSTNQIQLREIRVIRGKRFKKPE
ncbi:MAG: aminopeptidase [Anaerolineales bacterium]